jgi:RNA polymerase sigma factor (sigma-70 family)
MNVDTSITSAEDRDLLRRYAVEASVPAFDELVRRHLDHVFSSSLRRVNGDHALAQDVTQTVFIDFARKAGRIAPDVPPGGWLHRHTGFVASKMIDRERRRRAREQAAATMNTVPISTPADPEWSATAPLLDAAMDALPASDRDAIVLRFFEKMDFRSVGAALGMSDDSAQKKVSRAIDKLRGLLGRRGVASTSGALASLLAMHSVEAAPGALAGQISAQSLAGAATAGGTLGGAILGLSTAARVQGAAAVVAVAVVAGLAVPRFFPPEEPAEITSRSPVPTPNTLPAPATSPDPIPPQPAPQPLGVEALVAAAAAEWRGGNEGVTATGKALGFLSQITSAQMPEALEITAKLTDEPARALLTKHLLSHWAESEPRQAMAWATSDASQAHRADVVQGVLTAWAGRDPGAVMGWAGKTGTAQRTRLSESVIATVFRTLAKDDPATAIARLYSLASPGDRGQALRGILDTVQTEDDRERISSVIATIADDEIRVQARRAMVEQWARRDAPAAAAFVEKSEPAWERTRLMDSLGLTWLQSDPLPAAEWWVAHAPGGDTLVKIINVWAQQDPNAAGLWLGTQPPGASSDTARMTFARQVADLDAESALRWAESVTDAPMREEAINHIFTTWRTRDAAGATAFLQKSGWPAERVEHLTGKP